MKLPAAFPLAVAIILAAAWILGTIYFMPVQEQRTIHHAVVAGSWYPANRGELKSMVDYFLAGAVNARLNGTVRAVIVPHAGYPYSGQVAADAFAQVDHEYGKVYILGPSHFYPLEGMAMLNVTDFETPLGLVPVAGEAKGIYASTQAREVPEAFQKEHSIEAELPFLQEQVQGLGIVPMLVGEAESHALGQEIEGSLGNDDLIVVSADLSHFHDYGTAAGLDNSTLSAILRLDSNGIMDSEIDAPWAVAALADIARDRNWEPVVVKYANSGDVTTDNSSVVGYAAIVFVERPIAENDQAVLLNLSRAALDEFVTEGRQIQINESSMPEDLKKKSGCFVTLYENNQLRGCIGYILPDEPLYKCVIDNVINAAQHDPRFSPLGAGELNQTRIEISVLTNPKKLDFSSGDDLKGKLNENDGVVMRQSMKQSTYLPQVWEQIPDKELFLSSLCEKGGMIADCWNSTATDVFTYHALVFDESIRNGKSGL